MNDAGNEALSLPPLYRGELDDATLDQLFADLKSCAEMIQVQVRSMTIGDADQLVALHEAERAIKSGTARTVQIRYRHQGKSWCDTLLARPAGFHLVRIQLDHSEPGE